jgi:hypothetical protein
VTRSTGAGRGGARKGAGRPKRKTAPSITAPVPTGLNAKELASARLDAAFEVLAHICAHGGNDMARVRAARIIIALSMGKPIRPAGRAN